MGIRGGERKGFQILRPMGTGKTGNCSKCAIYGRIWAGKGRSVTTDIFRWPRQGRSFRGCALFVRKFNTRTTSVTFGVRKSSVERGGWNDSHSKMRTWGRPQHRVSTLADPPCPTDRRVVFCSLLNEPRQGCMLLVLHSTKVCVKFEAIVMVILKELIPMFTIALIT